MWLQLLLFLKITPFTCSCLQAVLAVMLLDAYPLPQCDYLQLIRSHHVVMLAAIQLLLSPCSYIPYPRVAKLPCECSGFIPRAWPFYCSGLGPLLSLLLRLRVMPITFLLGFNRTSLSLLRTAVLVLVTDGVAWISI